ncbi:MAG: hypothetical protein H0W41_02805 [Chloroflexi bacterium]|nr:hypothetical protein [Chloroflexota bacterium]
MRYDDDPWQVAIWTSTDGTAWELVPDLDSFGRAGLRDIASSDEGLMVAIGYEVLPPEEGSQDPFTQAGKIWRSENGIDWIAVEGIAGQFGDVAYRQGEWVVVGAIDGRAVIHTSADLVNWSTAMLDGLESALGESKAPCPLTGRQRRNGRSLAGWPISAPPSSAPQLAWRSASGAGMHWVGQVDWAE